jgi:aryl-alcohol dehydrogenase-like predicted oxidoreductase
VPWTPRRPAVDGAIVGFRCPDQIAPILGATELELTHEELERLREAK